MQKKPEQANSNFEKAKAIFEFLIHAHPGPHSKEQSDFRIPRPTPVSIRKSEAIFEIPASGP